MKSEYLEAGKFCGAHGVRGDIKAECWCDSTDVLKSLGTVYVRQGEAYRTLTVERCVPFKDQVLMHIRGIGSPEEAAFLKNKVFYAKREDLPLPEGSFFIADLIGTKVIDADSGRVYGKIKDVIDGAASQLYEIEAPDGKTVYLPVVPEFVIDIAPDERILVRPVKGLFDEN